MKRIEALAIFQLPTDATNSQIETIYQERFNNLQQQLRNSPTEFLKNKFQNNLDELERAYSVLKTIQIDNLPSAKPIALQEQGIATAPVGDKTVEETKSSPRIVKELEDLKKQKTYFLIGLIGLAAILSFFVVQYFDSKDLKPNAEKYEKIQKKLLNRKFAIRNAGKKTYEIIAYHITYIDQEGNLSEMEEGMKGEKYSFILEPDRVFTLTKVVGKNIVFDGKALSYTIILYQAGVADAEPKVFSGIFSEGNDTPLNPD